MVDSRAGSEVDARGGLGVLLPVERNGGETAILVGAGGVVGPSLRLSTSSRNAGLIWRYGARLTGTGQGVLVIGDPKDVSACDALGKLAKIRKDLWRPIEPGRWLKTF